MTGSGKIEVLRKLVVKRWIHSGGTSFTNLGAMKIVLGWRRFIIYILFTMAFAWGTGMIVDLLT